ncbi:unnamed protein product [Sphagnum troendelagicum]|uniref:Secreted protein n=1 Tax=Sphagnum troendelagicum TaxID=128251 RepID=A0ABP0TZ66_9BRYO
MWSSTAVGANCWLWHLIKSGCLQKLLSFVLFPFPDYSQMPGFYAGGILCRSAAESRCDEDWGFLAAEGHYCRRRAALISA